MTTSPLEGKWKPVDSAAKWEPKILNKMNLQRKQREMAFSTSLTHIGERLVSVLNDLQAGDDLYYPKVFIPDHTDEALEAKIRNANPHGDSNLDTLLELANQTWKVQLNLFFAIDAAHLFKGLEKICLPRSLLPLRWCIIQELRRIDVPGIQARAITVIYEYMWPKVCAYHMCSHFQLLIYMARVACAPMENEALILEMYFKVNSILFNQDTK